MGLIGRTALKAYFETNDIPTQAQYIDLLDSLFNLTDDDSSDLPLASDDNFVTDAEKIVIGNTSNTNSGNETAESIATINHASFAKPGLVDADEVYGGDSEDSFVLMRHTWTVIKAFLKTYFDTIYGAPIEPSVITPTDNLVFTAASGTMTTDDDRDIATIGGIEPRNSALFSLVGTGSLTFENCTGFVDQGTFTKVNGQYDLLIFNVSETGTPAYRIFDMNREPKPTQVLSIAASDETTDLDVSDGKAFFIIPKGFKLTEVKASLTTAAAGSNLTVDIWNTTQAGSLLSTPASDLSGTTKVLSTTSLAITDLAEDDEIRIDVDEIGSGTAGAGLKVYLIGYYI